MNLRQLSLIMISVYAAPLLADESSPWFLRSNLGYSHMSDPDAFGRNLGRFDGPAQVDLDGGFVAGLGAGYRLTPNWVVELAWEYRTNDSDVTLFGGERFTDGDYSSSLFFLNGMYFWGTESRWRPYVGAGLSWAQEVDIDLESLGFEQSFSDDGDVGYQVFAGVEYQLNDNWRIQTEARYGAITGLDLEAENGFGVLQDIDYKTTTAQLAVVYQF